MHFDLKGISDFVQAKGIIYYFSSAIYYVINVIQTTHKQMYYIYAQFRLYFFSFTHVVLIDIK